MSEITDVLEAIESLEAQGQRMALATIVAVRGSTYRRPGARLLVPEEGAPIGNLSGGCLEGDVADMARVVMDEGRARLAGWDLTADDDDVWGLGLGCNGAIEVFIEPAERAAAVTHALREALEQERSICVVTALESDVAGVEPGARLVVRPDGSIDGSLGDTDVDAEATVGAKELLAAGRSEIRTLAGSVRAFVEVLEPPLRLVLCGAGHDAMERAPEEEERHHAADDGPESTLEDPAEEQVSQVAEDENARGTVSLVRGARSLGSRS